MGKEALLSDSFVATMKLSGMLFTPICVVRGVFMFGMVCSRNNCLYTRVIVPPQNLGGVNSVWEASLTVELWRV